MGARAAILQLVDAAVLGAACTAEEATGRFHAVANDLAIPTLRTCPARAGSALGAGVGCAAGAAELVLPRVVALIHEPLRGAPWQQQRTKPSSEFMLPRTRPSGRSTR